MVAHLEHGLTAVQRRYRCISYEVILFAAVVGVAALDLPTVSFDSPQYIALAEGRLANVVAPFSDRVLGPFLSALLHSAFGLSIAAAFSAISLIGAALFGIGIHFIHRKYKISPYIWLPAVLAVPWVIGAIRDAYLPDILVMGLTSLFLLYFRNDNLFLAGVVAALSILARETGLILVFLAVCFAAYQRRWPFAAVLAVLSLAAFIVLKQVAQATTNVHAMDSLLYMALKIPVNFLRNVMGVEFWTNDMTWCNPPIVTVPVGHAVSAYFGKITAIGVCAPNVMMPIANTALALSTFGVLPGITIALMSQSRRHLTKDSWLLLVVLYGGIMFILGLCTGASVYRLVTYAWPLFIFGTPILWKANFEDEPFDPVSLIVVQLGLSWLGPILGAASKGSDWWQGSGAASAVALVAILLNVWAYRLVKAKRRLLIARSPSRNT
jgi:hypothetical protein